MYKRKQDEISLQTSLRGHVNYCYEGSSGTYILPSPEEELYARMLLSGHCLNPTEHRPDKESQRHLDHFEFSAMLAGGISKPKHILFVLFPLLKMKATHAESDKSSVNISPDKCNVGTKACSCPLSVSF